MKSLKSAEQCGLEDPVFIFARGGSKGLPNKNILPFHGKPLITWTIELAKKISLSQRVLVSTDSLEIAEISAASGAEVPYIRPSHLAADTSPEWHSWRYGLDFMRGKGESLPKAMVILPVTAPLRNVNDIQRCIETFIKYSPDAVITVSEARRNPAFNMVLKDDHHTVQLVSPPNRSVSRRQDAPVMWDVATVGYVLDPKFVLSKNSLFEGNVKAVVVPPERAVDIDSALDFEIAEYLMGRQINA